MFPRFADHGQDEDLRAAALGDQPGGLDPVRLPFGTIGLGADPMAPGFGARIFAAGDGGHSDYLDDGSPALASIARILPGHAPTSVSHAA
ncbi:hypothetical protein [Microbispora hainanensis]|uniref:hypothetical protein n=1 Tax=Microbispora hainanensis TaxID=568844 RepID=UPI003253B353